ncbi:MAG TPA: glycosyltransferase family 4 protein [Stellaceae bacterium]|jgi:glycosyltransferase involved in cell wall biosynthesis
MKRIIFVNRYFAPDHSATSQLLGDLAFHLAERGRDVSIITSRQRYDQPHAALPAAETIAGVRVHRVAATRFGRSRLFGRSLDYLSFWAAVGRAARTVAQPGDILVAKTDPPMLCVAARRAARRQGLILVNWLQDLYPEVGARLGVPLLGGPLGDRLMRLRDTALREAAANIAVSNRMAWRIRARGVAADRIHVIPNWCDDETIRPLPSHDNPLRREWGLEDRFVVGYSGNLGRAHEFETVVAAAELLRHAPRIVFLFIGDGRIDELRQRVGERGLEAQFRFAPYQDRDTLRHSLTLPDVHWLSLVPEVEGLIFPSKLYGIAAAGRPFIAVAAPDGEIAELTRQYGCGIVVEPDDASGFAAVLTRLSHDPAALVEMGDRARRMLDADFTRDHAFRRWGAVFDSLG